MTVSLNLLKQAHTHTRTHTHTGYESPHTVTSAGYDHALHNKLFDPFDHLEMMHEMLNVCYVLYETISLFT